MRLQELGACDQAQFPAERMRPELRLCAFRFLHDDEHIALFDWSAVPRHAEGLEGPRALSPGYSVRPLGCNSAAAHPGERAGLQSRAGGQDSTLCGHREIQQTLWWVPEREAKREQIEHAIAQLGKPVGRVTDPHALRSMVMARVAEWRALLRKHVEQGQQLLRRLIVGRLTLMPQRDSEGRYYRFTGSGSLARLFAGVVQNVASPTGFEPVFWP